jgi:signal transduction histidine kinase
LRTIAEFVENSIDAQAKTITITRGKEHNAHYLSIKDDGDGSPGMRRGCRTSSTLPLTSAIRSSGG